jgi:enamine deaminase RidA (YjgF/YER057c/UK114 family)
LNNLLAAWRSAGCGLEDVVKTTVYVASNERAEQVVQVEAVAGRG